MTKNASAAPQAEDNLPDLIQIDLNVSVRYNAGNVSTEWLKRQIESSFQHAAGMGALTGGSEAEVDVYRAEAIALSQSGASLTAANVATFMQDLLESGKLRVADVGRTMAHFARSSSATMREELAECMGLDGNEPAESENTSLPPKG